MPWWLWIASFIALVAVIRAIIFRRNYLLDLPKRMALAELMPYSLEARSWIDRITADLSPLPTERDEALSRLQQIKGIMDDYYGHRLNEGGRIYVGQGLKHVDLATKLWLEAPYDRAEEFRNLHLMLIQLKQLDDDAAAFVKKNPGQTLLGAFIFGEREVMPL